MISDLNRPMMVSKGVVVRVADAAHRGLDTRLEESFRVTDREVRHNPERNLPISGPSGLA